MAMKEALTHEAKIFGCARLLGRVLPASRAGQFALCAVPLISTRGMWLAKRVPKESSFPPSPPALYLSLSLLLSHSSSSLRHLPLPLPHPLHLFPPPSFLLRERESVFTCLRMTRACSFSPLRQQCVCPRLCILALLWRSPSSLSSAPPSRLCAEWQRGWAPSRPPWRPAYVRYLMVTEDVF